MQQESRSDCHQKVFNSMWNINGGKYAHLEFAFKIRWNKVKYIKTIKYNSLQFIC